MLFGDKQSAPYRHAHSTSSPTSPSKAQLEHEVNLVRIEAGKKMYRDELDFQERIFKNQQEEEQQEYLKKTH
jgi:hypothetical protein